MRWPIVDVEETADPSGSARIPRVHDVLPKGTTSAVRQKGRQEAKDDRVGGSQSNVATQAKQDRVERPTLSAAAFVAVVQLAKKRPSDDQGRHDKECVDRKESVAEDLH